MVAAIRDGRNIWQQKPATLTPAAKILSVFGEGSLPQKEEPG